MARRRQYEPLRVYLNNILVGRLLKEPGGAIEFRYDQGWLDRENVFAISLSLPLREDLYKGEPVAAVFENLLPDSDTLRRRVAEKVGADGTDAYSLLTKIGRDCVGALQFIREGELEPPASSKNIEGHLIDESSIERLLHNLAQAPLGISKDDDFRISVAGAQEKTALLRHGEKWMRPYGTTPTTHIFKTQIGKLPNGIDLSNSIENEYYCLKIIEAFGIPVNTAEIKLFGNTKALVIERFDRLWTKTGMLLRLPQEDCCQALSVPPTRKYEEDGGPGIVQILNLLKGSDTPEEDQRKFLIAQMIFWIIGATDGHAKNFSIFLTPKGGFHMTPMYDALTAQPSLNSHQIVRKQMRLAMCVGNNRHYRIDEIHPRHFVQTAETAGIPKGLIKKAFEHIVMCGMNVFDTVSSRLPSDFPESIHTSVRTAALSRLQSFESFLAVL